MNLTLILSSLSRFTISMVNEIKILYLHLTICCNKSNFSTPDLSETYLRMHNLSRPLLMSAVSEGNAQKVEGLVQMGCDVSRAAYMRIDGEGFVHVTPLHVAIHKRNTQIITLLLQSKTSIHAMKVGKLGHLEDPSIKSLGTPLEHALSCTETAQKDAIIVSNLNTNSTLII